MFNESWEGKDLAGFIKTSLAHQIQKSSIGGFIKTYGASSLLSTVSKRTSEENALKIADGIDMGYQVPKNIIPIIYGHIGMSNTQFDDGQKPSDLDSDKVVQSIKMPISEGQIAGVSGVSGNGQITFSTPGAGWTIGDPNDTVFHLQHVILNDSYIIDPTTKVANFKDVKFEMTLGDGGITSKQSSTLTKTNPLLGADIEALDDKTNDTLLNDLGDVQANKGVNNVLYWNTTAGKWEAKSFNTLLNEAGATYDGGAGGDGGSGGIGGSGGSGGDGGVGPSDGSGLKYTQYNPPPTVIESSTETTVITKTTTAPPSTGFSVVPGKGAPLRVASGGTDYFQSTIDFADVDETIDTIDATFYWPDGFYKEVTTVEKSVDGSTITLCGTTRPIAGSGDLDSCGLIPSVEVSDDGQTVTSKERDDPSVTVHMVLTTQLCGREFILHETSFPVGIGSKNGPYEFKHSMPLKSMNAGSGELEGGTQQKGALLPGGLTVFPYTTASCNSTDLITYEFKDWDLSDYLKAYPDQIVKAATTEAGTIIKVYAWLESVADISTNTYLREMSVCSESDSFDKLYSNQSTSVSPFGPFEPDHGFNWKKPTEADTGVNPYALPKNRCASEVTTGAFSTAKNPDPILVWDYTTMGEPGDVGAAGAGGLTGDGGESGTQGSVTVPNLDPIPNVEGKDGSYPGDGVATTVTLPTITVSNDDPSSTDTLTIAVSSGTLHNTIVTTGVTITGDNSSSLVLAGSSPDIQTCLDGGITFSSTTATTGDIPLTLTISSSVGSSLDNKVIRSQAVTAFVAPYFTITVTDYSAGDKTFDGYVRGIAIMNSITNTTSNDSAATDISDAINSYIGSPEWTATVSGAVVTVTGPVGIGASLNGIMPTQTGTMATSITAICCGVSPSRTSQPTRNAGNLKARFISALAFTNTLTDTSIAFAQLAYRPPQGDGQTTLSEVGFMVGGKFLPIPTATSFSSWAPSYSTTPAWGNNPAWVFFDYFTNLVYGLGNDINSKLDAEQKDSLYYDIYSLAAWCSQTQGGDQIIDCNAIIYGAESKIEVLQKIAALGHAKFVYLNGNPRLIFDGFGYAFSGYTPLVKKIVNQSNAGNLTYQSGSIDNLYNVINVKYANRDNFYRLEEVQYKNAASITTFGERETTIDLWGCSVKQQALWHGAWVYETEASNSETVSYIAGWDHYDVLPGDLLE